MEDFSSWFAARPQPQPPIQLSTYWQTLEPFLASGSGMASPASPPPTVAALRHADIAAVASPAPRPPVRRRNEGALDAGFGHATPKILRHAVAQLADHPALTPLLARVASGF